MPKKVLITLSLMGAALCNQDYMKTVFAEESRPSALLERSSVKIAITMENLNLRDKASTSGRILTTIPKGKTVTILSEKDENGWYKVSYDGKTGYAISNYIKEGDSNSESTESAPSKPTVSKTGTTTENLNLRNQASLSYTSGTIQSITSYLNPNNPANVNYLLQYLRIDQFRSFDVAGLNKELQNKGVLHNQGQIFYNASRYYNIDPIFFVSQSIHETNWGTSSLAKGITITEIADESKPIKDSSGNIIDYERIQLDKPVTVYNLFGIGARDHAPRLLGTTYAYKKGWTTPEKAIFGAAEFISLNYINSPKYQQNTPFKIKYNQLSANQWHQYATTPWYAYEIGNYMHRFAYLYDDDQEFLLDIPVYK